MSTGARETERQLRRLIEAVERLLVAQTSGTQTLVVDRIRKSKLHLAAREARRVEKESKPIP